MHIHAINTALIDVKTRYVSAAGRLRIVRLTNVLLDPNFTSIPVYTWAIEHPEGVIVIDTGESAERTNPHYFPAVQRPYWTSQYRFHVTPEQEIGPQLRQRGISPEDVRWLIMTHAHFDHSGGLRYFPNAEVIYTRKEYTDVQTFRSAHFDFPSKYPSWLKPRLIDFVPESVGTFAESFPVTKAGDVRLVPTPGHTMGHQSVVLQDEGYTFFFAGDASFDQASLLNGTLDAPAYNSNADLATRQRILKYAAQTPMVYLSTHDHQTEQRLLNRTTVY
jgi:glyoxylase-like metal-dependent hydrolase (beta-lactamase superfamily II)